MGFKIGIISDTHLGAFPLDPVLSKDPFDAFEEALKVLVKNGADIIIHAGDFYDRIDPPPWVEDRAISIIRSAITGDRSKLKVEKGRVNFEAEDVNIAVPLFLIHGTHDRPIGKPLTAPPFQHLIAAGYANYIDVDPKNEYSSKHVVLKNGETRVALTGVGHRPVGYINKSISEVGIPAVENAVNISMVHNAVEGILEKQEEYIDLAPFSNQDYLIVGHVHTARLNDGNLAFLGSDSDKLRLLVPGATIATGLYPQEEGIKFAHMLEVLLNGKASVKSFRLQNARQVFYKTLRAEGLNSEQVRSEIKGYLESLSLKESKKKPLVRVNITGKLAKGSDKREIKFDEIASEYKDKVHNWSEMLVPTDFYSEDELAHLEELKGAMESGTALTASLDRFAKKLKEINFPSKHFTPDEIYHLLSEGKATATRKRIEGKLNGVLGIEHH